MAWQDMQRTMKLLAALSEATGAGGKAAKSGGKGGGGKCQPKKRFCPWADCTAAQKQ